MAAAVGGRKQRNLLNCWLKLPQSLFLCGSVDRAPVSHTDKPQLCTPKNSTTKWAETVTCWKERWGEDKQFWFSVTSIKFDMNHRVTGFVVSGHVYSTASVKAQSKGTFFFFSPALFLFWNVQLVLLNTTDIFSNEYTSICPDSESILYRCIFKRLLIISNRAEATSDRIVDCCTAVCPLPPFLSTDSPLAVKSRLNLIVSVLFVLLPFSVIFFSSRFLVV